MAPHIDSLAKGHCRHELMICSSLVIGSNRIGLLYSQSLSWMIALLWPLVLLNADVVGTATSQPKPDCQYLLKPTRKELSKKKKKNQEIQKQLWLLDGLPCSLNSLNSFSFFAFSSMTLVFFKSVFGYSYFIFDRLTLNPFGNTYKKLYK